MPSVAIVGSQWGDEGKGKITDFLAEEADVVVRYQGGNNAGHTVVAGSDVFKLHLIPSGAIHPGKQCVLGNGVVIDPLVLVDELDRLRVRGVSEFTLHISERAHVIMPYHRVQDELEEAARGGEKIGTTGRGIGPAYVDKVARNGIRMIDLIDPQRFRRRLESVLPLKNRILKGFTGTRALRSSRLSRRTERPRKSYAHWCRTPPSWWLRRSSRGKRCFLKALRAPSWTSITAPIPLSRLLPRRLEASDRGWASARG